jgi:hypothetical protein
MLKDHGFSGAASLECEARGGPVLQRSIGWTRKVLDELGYRHDLPAGIGDGSEAS